MTPSRRQFRFARAATGTVLLTASTLWALPAAAADGLARTSASGFWNLVFFASLVVLVLLGFSFARVLYVRKKKKSRIYTAAEFERQAELGMAQNAAGSPPQNPGSPEFSAQKTVDPGTGKVTYDMHPLPDRNTEVGTFAYIIALLGILSLMPVYGLAAGIAVLVLAPVAARRFAPSLERVIGFKLIILAIVAAGIGAIASLFSALASSRVLAPSQAIGTVTEQKEIPMYVPFALLAVLIVSVVIHEVAHGLTAYWCGDSTAKRLGRLTLNPIRHFDLFGSFILPAMLFFATGFRFAVGYAKPVPINPGRLGRRPRDDIFVSTSGACANFMLCALALALLAIVAFLISFMWPGGQVSGFSDFLSPPVLKNIPAPWLWALLVQVLKSFFVVNIVLGILNLIPIPPLDGSFALESLLPRNLRLYFRLMRLTGFVMLIAVVAILVYSGIFAAILKLMLKTSVLIHFVVHLS